MGYNPQLRQLRATINIFQAGGYAGSICSGGSHEYVRFYLSHNGGATWQDQGLRAVQVFNVPGPKPLEYAVTLPISPVEEFCFIHNLPLVRAILSWNYPPPAGSPNFIPVWGNVVDAQVQIDGFEWILLKELLSEAKLDLPEQLAKAVDLNQPVKVSSAQALSPLELHNLYANTEVPQHRYLAKLLTSSAQRTAVRHRSNREEGRPCSQASRVWTSPLSWQTC